MEPVTVREARRRLGEIIRAAERGETVVVTRRGKVVACIGPAPKGGPPLPDLSEFRASIRVKGKPLSEELLDLRESGRY